MDIILQIAVVVLAGLSFSLCWERRRQKLLDASSFLFRFPRRPVPAWTSSDDTLARLVYDYELSDSEIDLIVKDGIKNAAQQYRKDHPLDGPPPSDVLYETVFPHK